MHPALVVAVLSTVLISVKAQGVTCDATSACPASAPCCSEFGYCGDDNFCLGGCNPLHSYSLTSCRSAPLCEDATHTFADNSRILSNSTYYDGNSSAYDWVVDKGAIFNTNSSGGELALVLTEDNGGTRLSSTKYLHYGTVTATLKTGRWAGVVTAFITMSDIKDEIDWEFPGTATTEAQTNYFWQGVVPLDTHGTTVKDLSDTYTNYHDYTIDWQPETLTFSIDGNVVRTIQQSDTVQDGVTTYPSTPSRIQLSLWPAGINSSAPGTVQWAGGMIDWSDPDYTSAGHFYALVKSVQIKCGDPQAPGENITSYVYGTNSSTDTPAIAFTNASTLINGAAGVYGEAVKVNGLLTVGLLVAALLVQFL
ncbi:glycoside hydrolase family 16 protein [Mucidula mucida]|nr:glycoside hydrolase family 16 protein [Mucidula mucida]